MIVSSDIIASIAHDLSRSQEAKRAKKLIFYVSQRYWESDFSIINSYSFESLLQSLYDNNPTIDDLKALLYHAVNTLNRKEVYNKIGKYIFQRMSELYNNPEINSDIQNASQTNENELIDRIVENIEYHEESPRIKKLIFAACKQYWENDITVIEMYDLRELLLELHELYPNPKRLKKAFDNIVSTINRQNFYSFIADTIVGELTYLYKHETPEIIPEANTGQEEEETKLIKAKAKNTSSQNSQKANTSEVSTNIQSSTSQENPTSEPDSFVSPSSVPEGQIVPWLKIDSLFDLKQEIMQYTNPLRAKIILFYAVYQIDPCEQHWFIVRTCSMDDLLVKMFQQNDKDIKTIEAQLLQVAHSNIEGLDPEDNAQTVGAIVESIKRFYKKL
ncbi:hypothetical protein GM3708_1131 [Geminocystis sp. NIES-3708]|uniref:hypothetical protein n=1 Tax=Geminocystis sp. NIES-3708 TaxID=1615909 RepID=UPI0005FC4E47|nr:hypothetical protein [Geminocystis sp. NIES-3708]BAQ60725.1 hypothetical protein GM3708_1131 [Geminocystis sp. NIES-3708]